MGIVLRDHEGDPPALRQRRRSSWPPTRRTRSCRPGCTRSCWSPSCTSRPCGRWPSRRRPGPTCSRASTSPPTRAPTDRLLEEWDERRIDVPAEGAALAVPRGDPADRRLRHRDPQRQPARRGRGLHPGVRRRPLVGAAAAQPDRAAAQGPAALHARRDGDLGALPAALLPARPGARASARPAGRAPATCGRGRRHRPRGPSDRRNRQD